MAWVKLDDMVVENRKHLRAGPAACWLWVCGIAYAQRQLSDGFIPDEALPIIGVAKGAKALAERLVAVGLFEKVTGGYQVHHYLDHNLSRTAALARREEQRAAKVKAGQAGSQSRWQTDSRRDSRPIADGNSRPIAPSHPIPSVPDPPVREIRATAPIIGKNPHLAHTACDPTLSRCVPATIHHKFADALAPKFGGDRDVAKDALKTWYATVWATLPADFVMGDAFKFWQGRFDAAFATPDPTVRRPLLTTTDEEDGAAVLELLRKEHAR